MRFSQQSNIIVLDSGGCTCKIGWAGQPEPTSVFPNAVGKVKGQKQSLVGEQILECQELSALNLRRPVDRGFVISVDLQREVWSRAFRSILRASPSECGLVLTEPLFNLPAIQDSIAQVLFEDFNFQSVVVAPAASLALRRHWQLQPGALASQAGCGVVLDAGFSSTHAVPIFDGNVLDRGVRRLNLGGKVLTNYMKELVSYRSINMMEETYLVERIKNSTAFVSQDLRGDLALSRQRPSPHALEYVLPDGVRNVHGYTRQPQPAAARAKAPPDAKAQQEQVLSLNNERFMVPELLFNPPDIALKQAGAAEMLVDAVAACHPDLQQLLYSNVLLVGGSACCPGFKQRFETELRALVPDKFSLQVHAPPDPVTCAWRGGSALAASPAEYEAFAMTRAQYAEVGRL